MLTKEQLEKMAKNYGIEVLEIDIPPMKAAQTALVYIKALELAGEYFQDYGACPLDFGDGFDCEDIPELECHEEERCWKEYFLWKARAEHE